MIQRKQRTLRPISPVSSHPAFDTWCTRYFPPVQKLVSQLWVWGGAVVWRGGVPHELIGLNTWSLPVVLPLWSLQRALRRWSLTGESASLEKALWFYSLPHVSFTLSVECGCNVTICPPAHSAMASSPRWAIYHETVSFFTLLLVGEFVSTTRKETKTREPWLS